MWGPFLSTWCLQDRINISNYIYFKLLLSSVVVWPFSYPLLSGNPSIVNLSSPPTPVIFQFGAAPSVHGNKADLSRRCGPNCQSRAQPVKDGISLAPCIYKLKLWVGISHGACVRQILEEKWSINRPTAVAASFQPRVLSKLHAVNLLHLLLLLIYVILLHTDLSKFL